MKTLPRLSLRESERRWPEATALIDGEGALSFRAWAQEVRPWAATIAAAAEDRAAWTALPTRDGLTRLMGVIDSGKTVVPLHPRMTPIEASQLRAAAAPTLDLDQFHPRPGKAAEEPWPPLPSGPGHPLAIVFTSGTTGEPKGVILPRSAFAASAAASASNIPLGPGDRWLLSLSPARVGGLSVITRCLAAGAAVVLPERPGAEALAEALERHQVSHASFVPTQLAQLLKEHPRPAPPSLKVVLLGGAAAPAELLRTAEAAGWPVRVTYGMTETCSQVATQSPGDPPGTLRPLPGIDLRIREGRIEIRGPVLCSGFLDEGGVTTPFTADGWFRTGDRGQINEDRSLTVWGRADDLIITGGENVDPGAVEQVIGGCPGVREAQVFPLADPVFGQTLALAVVPDPDVPDLPRNLARWCRERLAPFRRPRRLVLVDALPRTPEGKIDRRGAARRWADRLEPWPARLESEGEPTDR